MSRNRPRATSCPWPTRPQNCRQQQSYTCSSNAGPITATSMSTIMYLRTAILLSALPFTAYGQTSTAGRIMPEGLDPAKQQLYQYVAGRGPRTRPRGRFRTGLRNSTSVFPIRGGRTKSPNAAELKIALAKVKSARAAVTDKNVQQDIDILQKSYDLRFRTRILPWPTKCRSSMPARSFSRAARPPDDQVAAERRPAALVRLRKYAGVEPGISRSPNC